MLDCMSPESMFVYKRSKSVSGLHEPVFRTCCSCKPYQRLIKTKACTEMHVEKCVIGRVYVSLLVVIQEVS